jgi:hypothetical protein
MNSADAVRSLVRDIIAMQEELKHPVSAVFKTVSGREVKFSGRDLRHISGQIAQRYKFDSVSAPFSKGERTVDVHGTRDGKRHRIGTLNFGWTKDMESDEKGA